MANGAIYVPQWDPWAGVRQGIMALAMGYGKGLEKKDLGSQISQLMANLPGTREQQTLSPVDLQSPGGIPSPGPGISIGGGVDIGAPAAPAIVEQVQDPFDLKKVMGGITDPDLASRLLPTMMNYDQESKRTEELGKVAEMKERYEQAKEANKPLKMTVWKGDKAQEFMVPQNKWNEVAGRFAEKGYTVSDSAPPRPPEKVTWTSYKDPATGRFVQKSSTGEVKDYPGQTDTDKPPTKKEAAEKIASIEKGIYSLKTKGTLDDPIMAVLASQNPNLVESLKGDPKEAVKTLEAERDFYMPYAPDVIKKRYAKPAGTPAASGGITRMVWDPKLKKAVPIKGQ